MHGPIDREAVRTRRREHELQLLEIEELRPGILDYLEEAERSGLKEPSSRAPHASGSTGT